ncbi:MAG TPA: hypothetical protein VN643_17450 [Pyrinomonadaceae bacterium]|nr:hypothetical protein [Pyrinomonadaceae bacterium]
MEHETSLIRAGCKSMMSLMTAFAKVPAAKFASTYEIVSSDKPTIQP